MSSLFRGAQRSGHKEDNKRRIQKSPKTTATAKENNGIFGHARNRTGFSEESFIGGCVQSLQTDIPQYAVADAVDTTSGTNQSWW